MVYEGLSPFIYNDFGAFAEELEDVKISADEMNCSLSCVVSAASEGIMLGSP